jgi:hypothetical protein
MQNRNRYRDPFAKNPMERTNPFDMGPMRPVRRPAPMRAQRQPRQQPQNNGMGDAANGIVDVAKLGIIAGTTMGITSGIIGAIKK